MTAKSNKKNPLGNKNDIKATVIVVLLFIVGMQAFLLFHKEKKEQPKAVKTVESKAHAEKLLLIAVPAVVKKALPGSAGKIAFILDDWGYSMRNCKYLKAIDAPLAIAILPNLRHTQDIAQCAQANNKSIMLHLPLEPYHNNDPYPDNYLITTTMKSSQVERLLDDTLAKMPLVQGVNNHMGSRATEDQPLMKLIFKHLKKKGLFFVDSMTSPNHSICGEVADQMHLPFAQRDVFLDNDNKKDAIEKQIALVAQKARQKGFAIAIGHDRELTLRVLKDQIPLLKEEGFEIVHVKDLLKNK